MGPTSGLFITVMLWENTPYSLYIMLSSIEILLRVDFLQGGLKCINYGYATLDVMQVRPGLIGWKWLKGVAKMVEL